MKQSTHHIFHYEAPAADRKAQLATHVLATYVWETILMGTAAVQVGGSKCQLGLNPYSLKP